MGGQKRHQNMLESASVPEYVHLQLGTESLRLDPSLSRSSFVSSLADVTHSFLTANFLLLPVLPHLPQPLHLSPLLPFIFLKC